MDILLKLRIFFWTLVIILWGMLMYQFMNEDIHGMIPKMKLVKNPFSSAATAPLKVMVTKVIPAPLPYAVGRSCSTIDASTAAVYEKISPGFLKPIAGGQITGVAGDGELISEHSSREREDAGRIKKRVGPPDWPRVPSGFSSAQAAHFVVYQEGDKTSPKLLANLEKLHENLMLDLIAFSPWSRDEKILIYFFKTHAAYRRVTGRPSWSGGASSLSRRTIYVYESREAFGILAHELCHIYFDGFFGASRPSPLWLSEGMATYIQTERGMAPPNWLKANLAELNGGAGFKFQDLMRIEDTRGAGETSVRLWYTQSYSVVRFMMRLRAGDSFYQFCKMLRDGRPVNESLFRAYGRPFNRITALEYAWRYDLKTKGLSSLTE
ncbi:MAG: hypothetical protein ABIG11_09870 [bacterium]